MKKLSLLFGVICLLLSTTISMPVSSRLMTEDTVTKQEIENVKLALRFDLKAVQQVIEGFLSQLATTTSFTSIQACIQLTTEVINNLVEAYIRFSSRDPNNIAKGFEAFYNAMKGVPIAFQGCKGALPDVQRLVEALKKISNPLTLVTHGFKNLILHGYDIYQTVSRAVSCFKAQDWKGFGTYCGEVVYKLFLLDSTSVSKPLVFTKDMVMMESAIIGFILPEMFTSIAPCLSVSIATFGSNFEKAIDQLLSPEDKDVAQGVQTLGITLEFIPKSALECQADVKSVAKMTTMIDQLKSKNQVQDFIAQRNNEIWSDLISAIVSYKNKLYEEAGSKLYLVLIASSMLDI